MKQLPVPFLDRMRQRLLPGEFESFVAAYEKESAVAVRLNPLKEMEDFSDCPQIPWFKEGCYLNEKKRFITDPLWHAGTYYVQEPSSMILGEIFRQLYTDSSPERALDLCAAPGGKSTLLQSILVEDSVLIANEVIKPRAQILKENHIRMGLSANLLITRNDPGDFTEFENFFDYIQVDAPCSGEGMFRKDDIALREWSEANCDLCSGRSERILSSIIPTLSQNGILVYSTCTFNPEENEMLLSKICRKFDMTSVPVQMDEVWGVSEVNYEEVHGYYFYPHKVKGEGLFVSVLRKNSGDSLVELNPPKKIKSVKIPELIEYEGIIQEKENLILKTPELNSVKNAIEGKLNIGYEGVELGMVKGKNFIPSQALANYHKKLHNFPEVEVDEASALNFLRGEDPKVDLKEKGIYLLTHKNTGLGFIKFLGNRSNNYYPKPWRIRNY